MVSAKKILDQQMGLTNPSDNIKQQLDNVCLEWKQQDTTLTIGMKVVVVMEMVFNQMRNDLLSKWFRVAIIDCHNGSQVDAK